MLFQKASLRAGFSVNQEETKKEEKNNLVQNTISNNTNNNEIIVEEQKKWYIEIPAISLKAEIAEGTTKEVMNKFVGHFEETTTWIGNVGLAAHNRGYENNYFTNLKKLKEGDIINYYYNGNMRTYTVSKQVIVEDTDWSYLENTEENILTLITCVENEPSYRRCVQATEDTNN